MKKKNLKMILTVTVLCAAMAVPAGAARAETESELPEDGVYSITADYSATDLAGQEFEIFEDLRAFSDAACENGLDLQVLPSPGENKISYQFEQDTVPETVYLKPLIVSLSQRTEKTILDTQIEDGTDPDGFHAKEISVRKKRSFPPDDEDLYEVNVVIESETGKYPDRLKMVSGGRIYSSGRTISDLWSDTDGSISEYSFHFEVASDEASAQAILDDAYFTYTWITHFEVADNWDYSSENVELKMVDIQLVS